MADDDNDHQVPEWVVTYGDMMSLLLTFFIMLVSLSEVIEDERYRAILESILSYTGYHATTPAPTGQDIPLNSLIESMRTLGSFTEEKRSTGGVKPEAVEGKHVRIYRTREGGTVRVGEPVLFSPGEVRLSRHARDRLRHVADELAGKPNKVEIRGFPAGRSLAAEDATGDKRILAYRRGRAVADFLVERGIARDRLRISALAHDGVPRDSEKPAFRRGRVEVHISDAHVSHYIGPRDTAE